MRVPLGSEEPEVASWDEVEPAQLLDRLGLLEQGRPRVLAVDGRSGAGKSSLAGRLAAAVPGAAVVATDDIAWNLSMFGWADELAQNVIMPARAGRAVHYRPPGWIAHDRPGAVTVAADRPLLIIEGVGSSRRALTGMIDAALWVQSDRMLARERGLERDAASGVNGDRQSAEGFWDRWQAEELPFLEDDAPWERAAGIVAGVPVAGAPVLRWHPRSADARPGLAPQPPTAGEQTAVTVDGEDFVITRRPDEPGSYHVDWVSHPDGYGFGGSGPEPLDQDAIVDQIRAFLAEIDPATGFLRD